MLLSDRDIRAELDAGRVILDPYDPDMVQPASIDVRLDRWFRLFDNHRYPVIDPAVEQDGLTHLVDVGPDDPFVLHPGEFVLGATYESVALPDDVAARLEGKSSLGRLGLLTHLLVRSADVSHSGILSCGEVVPRVIFGQSLPQNPPTCQWGSPHRRHRRYW